MNRTAIQKCFQKPVIPVAWDPGEHADLIAKASTVFLQGGKLAELRHVLERFQTPTLRHVALFAHIDLLAGLENSEAGLEYLAEMGSLTGIVTVHHHLAKAAKRMNLMTVVRVFVSDSRAVERGASIAERSLADAIEILPAAAAPKVAEDFNRFAVARIAGGLCRTREDVREALDSGCVAVTSTRPALWELNGAE